MTQIHCMTDKTMRDRLRQVNDLLREAMDIIIADDCDLRFHNREVLSATEAIVKAHNTISEVVNNQELKEIVRY